MSEALKCIRTGALVYIAQARRFYRCDLYASYNSFACVCTGKGYERKDLTDEAIIHFIAMGRGRQTEGNLYGALPESYTTYHFVREGCTSLGYYGMEIGPIEINWDKGVHNDSC